MKPWCTIPMARWAALALAGALQATALPAWAASATVYYYTPYKNWSAVNIHHNASGSWTAVPGVAMTPACPAWAVRTLDFSSASFETVFNSGSSSAWDNPLGGGNYGVPPGVHQVREGTMRAGAGDPCSVGGNTATIYYKPNAAWSGVNIHYATNGGPWTLVPGVPMDTACTGWRVKQIQLGAATGMAVTFNNGSSWDNNGGNNYALGTGVIRVENGSVTANASSPCGVDTTPPTQPGTPVAVVNGTTVTLAWTASTDPESTVSYVLTRTGGTSGTVSFQAPAASHVDSSGAPNTVYSYSVVARNTAGLSSAASNPVVVQTGEATAPAGSFSWDNATVYFLLSDRFVNSDTGNDRSYCRESTQGCTSFGNDLAQMPSGFHGGDLKGITQKINANYFRDLGVNALWITPPYEQIHGFVFGGNGHKHYGYHGYYALDWTTIDKNMGTAADLQAMVDAAHAQGIRVVMDVVLNHTGYENIKDMAEYGYGALNAGWENTAYKSADVLTDWNADIGQYINYGSGNWASSFWTPAWIRLNNAAGYSTCEGTDGLRGCVGFLPDIKTELTTGVGLPPILNLKWGREGRLAAEQQKLDTWFAQNGKARTPANHLIKWLSDYVRQYGIDGFRVDTAKHVELNVWKDLKDEAVKARQEWLAANPAKAAQLKGDTAFWMTGEVWDHGVGRSAYFDNGFDSIINFSFQGAAGNVSGLHSTYTQLAAVNADNSTPYNLLSYISSHDKGLFDRNNLQTGLTSLLLAPGGVQVFYGDESARPLRSDWSGDHAWRGDMNWDSPNAGVLAHAQKLGRFRNAHVAVGAGTHAKLADSPFTFSRVKDSDKVVVAISASGTAQIVVAGVFADGSLVRDAYTGAQATVAGGRATVAVGSAGVVLLESAQ
jgi:glycosidase